MPMIRKHLACLLFVSAIAALPATPATAVDPPYQDEMQRLLEVMGSLYFLEPLCEGSKSDWRAEASELVVLDQPDPDREQRLYGAFNRGYQSYARLYRFCTLAAREAMLRLFDEAEAAAKDIHSKFAE